MTDREMLTQALESGKDDFFKRRTITKLMGMTNVQTGMLMEQLYIPVYDVEEKFLLELLEKLGYHYKSEEEYNSFFEQCCLRLTLSKKS